MDYTYPQQPTRGNIPTWVYEVMPTIQYSLWSAMTHDKKQRMYDKAVADGRIKDPAKEAQKVEQQKKVEQAAVEKAKKPLGVPVWGWVAIGIGTVVLIGSFIYIIKD